MSSVVALKGVLQCLRWLGKGSSGCAMMHVLPEAIQWYASLKAEECSREGNEVDNGWKTYTDGGCSKQTTLFSSS